MKLSANQIIYLPVNDMRNCRSKILTLLKNELAVSDNVINNILSNNKVILVVLKEGYFPIKCRLTRDELDHIDLRLMNLTNITKEGYIIIKDINHISLDFIQNQLSTIA